jgi:tetratricopeptide (TPR) repeat protein
MWADVDGLPWQHLDRRRDGLLRGEMGDLKQAEVLDYAKSLQRRNMLDQAVTILQHLTKAHPEFSDAFGNLGWFLGEQRKWAESADACRAAIRLNARVGWYHNNLGVALQGMGQLEEAAEEYRLALRYDPTYDRARGNLQNLEPLLDSSKTLLPLLEAFRRGEAEPVSADECLKLAVLCRHRKLYFTASRLYADAFRADPKRAEELTAWHRYNLACYCALAAVGEGADGRPLPDKVVVMLRRQALAALRADLAVWRRRRDGGKPEDLKVLVFALQHWQVDRDLVSVRDPDELAKLPAAEAEAYRQLWDDVAALLRATETP